MDSIPADPLPCIWPGTGLKPEVKYPAARLRVGGGRQGRSKSRAYSAIGLLLFRTCERAATKEFRSFGVAVFYDPVREKTSFAGEAQRRHPPPALAGDGSYACASRGHGDARLLSSCRAPHPLEGLLGSVRDPLLVPS